MSDNSGPEIKMAIFAVLGFTASALLGYQIGLQAIPPTSWSPYYWFVFGVGGGLLGMWLSDST